MASESPDSILIGLHEAAVEYIVVGGTAAVLLGAGYDELLPDTVFLDEGPVPLRVLDLPRLIVAKSAAGRAKDRAVLPLLLATLDERRKK